MLDRFHPMLEAIANACGQNRRDGLPQARVETFMDDIASQRQRQAIVFLAPPDAQVFAEHETLIAISELAFMDDQPCLCFAAADCRKDLIEGNNDQV